MTSSALTGNTSGLASAVSPGLVGTGTQTFAGDKTLTGLITASGGIINTGLTGANATTVSTAGSLKVGEYKLTSVSLTSQSSATNITGSNFITCTSGLWLIKSIATIGVTAPTKWAVGIALSASGSVATSSTGMTTEVLYIDQGNTTQGASGVSAENYFILTSSQNFYPYVLVNSPTSTNYSITMSIQAIRIA